MQAVSELLATVKRVRKECPWDREQTHESIRHMLIEEAYEVVESIEQRKFDELKGELGDILLHVLMHSVMAEEKGTFTIDDVVRGINDKLIRRHPHVFGSGNATTAKEVKTNWERMKLEEGRNSILDGVPRNLPALLRAARLQDKASKVGFDWNHITEVWKKVEEELTEFKHAEEQGESTLFEREFGDLLFALVNYARFLSLDPEMALRHTIDKFENRFRYIEDEFKKQGKKMEESTLEEMDIVWNESKRLYP